MEMMIIGDPYKFSFFIEVIDEWNIDETFLNGVLLFSIDGNYFPKEITTTTLKGELRFLKEKLLNPAVNKKIFAMQTKQAFAEIYNRTFPEDINVHNDYSYDISPHSFSDNGYFTFLVSNGDKVRIMASYLEYILSESRHNLQKADILETMITAEELKEMILKLDHLFVQYQM